MNYVIHADAIDLSVALDCEADRARRDEMHKTSDRQAATALHIRNAVAHFQDHCPAGMRVQVTIQVDHVPDVNPVLRDDVRDRRHAST